MARKKGVIFIRYEEDKKPEVNNNGPLKIKTYDPVINKDILIETDLLILSAAILPNDDNEEIGKMLKIPLNQNKFFLEAHMKLRPVDFATEGVFLCGLAHGPKLTTESIIQANAAAGRINTVLSKDHIILEPTISNVIDENCDGCAYCIDPCPYDALTLIEYVKKGEIKKVAESNPTACKGCGVCQATCPKKGIEIKGFKLEQLSAMIEAALEPGG